MSPLGSQSTNNDFHYVGSELEVFAHAIHWKSYFARQLRPFIQGNVLEVGAGIGATTRILASGHHDNWTCLEPDAELAEQLRVTVQQDPAFSRISTRIIVGAVPDLPADAVFDCILYMDVLEHIQDDAEELRRAARHLAPRGHLVVLSPAHQWLFSPFDEAIGHYRRYTRHSLRDAGPDDLRLVRLRYLDSVGLLASLANRLLLRSSSPSHGQVHFWDSFMVPLSRGFDPVLGYRVGKSIYAVWQR